MAENNADNELAEALEGIPLPRDENGVLNVVHEPTFGSHSTYNNCNIIAHLHYTRQAGNSHVHHHHTHQYYTTPSTLQEAQGRDAEIAREVVAEAMIDSAASGEAPVP